MTDVAVGAVAKPVFIVSGSGGGSTPAGTSSDPVYTRDGPSGATPVTGTFAATGSSALFTAQPGFSIWVKLSGTFVATVQVERCSDGTTGTAQVLTVNGSQFAVFTGPCQEVVSAEGDAGVAYRLTCTSYTSGTVTYQIGHH